MRRTEMAALDCRALVERAVWALLVGALAFSLAACGSSNNTLPSGARTASPSAEPSLGEVSASAIIDALGAAGLPCTNVSTRDEATNVADEVKCSIGADDVIIRTFATSEERDRYVQGVGNMVGQLSFDVEAVPQLVGPAWIVTTDTRATAEKIRQILGGELRE